MNYYYSSIAHVLTYVSYAVSQTNTILIVIICGITGAFILYQNQKSNKENIGKLIRLQLFITAILFTVPIICDFFCYILNVSYNSQIPFLFQTGMAYITVAIWVATALCFTNHIRQKRKTE
jgi:hypothetical protein